MSVDDIGSGVLEVVKKLKEERVRMRSLGRKIVDLGNIVPFGDVSTDEYDLLR